MTQWPSSAEPSSCVQCGFFYSSTQLNIIWWWIKAIKALVKCHRFLLPSIIVQWWWSWTGEWRYYYHAQSGKEIPSPTIVWSSRSDKTKLSGQFAVRKKEILLPTTVQLPSCSSRTEEERRKNLVTSASVVDWLLSGCVVGRQFNAI